MCACVLTSGYIHVRVSISVFVCFVLHLKDLRQNCVGTSGNMFHFTSLVALNAKNTLLPATTLHTCKTYSRVEQVLEVHWLNLHSVTGSADKISPVKVMKSNAQMSQTTCHDGLIRARSKPKLAALLCSSISTMVSGNEVYSFAIYDK